MKVANRFAVGIVLCALPLALAGCGGGGGGEEDVPPTGAANIKQWLQTESYKDWKCEGAAVAPRGPSPHKFNRICSNAVLSGTAAGMPFPQHSAAVKEIHETADGPITGYAVYHKTQADSANGMGWYYYEEVPDGMVIADGQGAMACIGCHGAAGSDDAHLKANGAHDYVYIQVK